MKLRICSLIVLCLIFVCLSCTALAGKAVCPWMLELGNEKWGPVSEDRLEIQLLKTNGNIVSKYHQNTGILYHSYIGNPRDHVISDETFTRVVIHPPRNAVYRINFYYEGISLKDPQINFKYTILEEEPDTGIADVADVVLAVNNPDITKADNILDNHGPVYYDWDRPLFEKNNNDVCMPKQRASQDRGNVYLAAWYDASMKLIRVDWMVETADDFSIPKADISQFIFSGYDSEKDLPDRVVRPSLIIPPSRYNWKFRLGVYFYPSCRGNTDFAELYLLHPEENMIIPDYDEGPVVIYWPYPQGYSHTSPVHYHLKHYMDNTRTEFEILDVTPTPKGLRIVTNSFSPFELTWSEPGELPDTGDHASSVFWFALLVSSVCVSLILRRRANT